MIPMDSLIWLDMFLWMDVFQNKHTHRQLVSAKNS